MIRKIEKLRPSDIDEALNQIPDRYLRTHTRKFIRKLLLIRKQKIRKMIYAWLNFKGLKEYGSE